jgi:hypothetical protein
MNQWVYGQTTSRRVMGDTPARLIYGIAVALSFLAGGAPLLVVLLAVPAVWVGTTTGNFNSLSMGRAHYSFLHDYWGMSAHAALSAIAPALLVWWFGGDWLVLAALIMLAPEIYILGWLITGKVGYKDAFPVGLKGSCELAEAGWGAVTALGAYLAFA